MRIGKFSKEYLSASDLCNVVGLVGVQFRKGGPIPLPEVYPDRSIFTSTSSFGPEIQM